MSANISGCLTDRWFGVRFRGLHALVLLLFIAGLIIPVHPAAASTPLPAAPTAAPLPSATAALSAAPLDAPPTPPPAPPAGDSCAAVLLPAQSGAAHCLFGAVYLDGEPVADARVQVRNTRGEVEVWSALAAGQPEPRYGIDLRAAPLSAQRGEDVTVRVSYAGRVREVPHEVLAGQQRLDLALPVGGAGDRVPELAIKHRGEPGSFLFPAGIAVAPKSGAIYVTDWGNSFIHAFDSEGRFLRRWGELGDAPGQLSHPTGIAIDTRDMIYVADRNTHRVTKFSAAGDLLLTIGATPGNADGQLLTPLGLAALEDTALYVADSSNRRIQRFRNDGSWEASFGGWGGETFNVPTGVAVDDAGTLYVADSTRNSILKFSVTITPTAQLHLQTSWPARGTLFPNLEVPGQTYLQLSLDAKNGLLYVTDRYGSQIHRFTLDGEYRGTVAAGGPGNGAGQVRTPDMSAVSADGQLYVADYANHRVQVFSSDGTALRSWGQKSTSPGVLSFAMDSARAPDGRIYVADTDNNQVQVFTASGAFLTRWGSRGAGLNQFNTPTGIAVAADGRVYVADTINHRIQRFDSMGGAGTVLSLGETLNGPTDIALTADTIYVVDSGNNRILSFDVAAGSLRRKWGETGSADGQFNDPAQIAVGDSGQIYVTDTSNHRVQVFTADGSHVRTIGERGSGPGQLILPSGMVVSAGLVFVSGAANSSIGIFDAASGAYRESFSGFGSGPGRLFSPTGLNADGQGRITVTDRNNSRIQVLRPLSARAADPVATIVQATPRIIAPGDSINLRGAGASPPGAAITGYAWLIDGEPFSTEQNPTLDTTLRPLAHGRHGITLRVTDDQGRVSEPQPITFEVDACLGAGEGGATPSCLVGSVILDGAPVSGARVEVKVVALDAGRVVETWTEARAGEPYPTFRVDLAALGASLGGRIKITASASGHSTFSVYKALGGRQRVDLVLPRDSRPADYALEADYWRPGQPGTFFYPDGVAVDSRDNVYISDYRNGRVQVFGPGGQFLRQWGTRLEGADQLDLPSGIAIDDQDNVYVSAGSVDGRVFKFSPAGVLLASWGGPGSSTTFTKPEGLALAGDTLYVLDRGRGQVALIDMVSGKVDPWTPESDKKPGYLSRMTGIAVDPDGNVYIADGLNHRVEKFDRNGKPIHSWGAEGSAAGQFREPYGITVDQSGTIYVVDRLNHRVQRLAAADANNNTGEFAIWAGGLAAFRGQNGRFYLPTNVATDSAGQVYVVDPFHARYQVFDAQGNWVQSRVGSEDINLPREGGTAPGRLALPNGIAIDQNGDLLVADTGNGRLQKLTPAGDWLASYGRPGTGPGEFGFAQCIELDDEDFIYVCDGVHNRVQVFAPDGSFVRLWDGSENGRGDTGRFGDPRDIAVDSANDLVYVADSTKNRIQKFTRAGDFVAEWITQDAAGALVQPHGLVLDEAGALYVSDLPATGQGCIQKLNADGVVQKRLCGVRAHRLDIGPDGLLYVSATENNSIRVYSRDLDDTLLGNWRDSRLGGPIGVAFDAAGTAYVLDLPLSRLLRFRPMRHTRPIATIVQSGPRVLAPGAELRPVGMGSVSKAGTTITDYAWRIDDVQVATGAAPVISTADLAPGQHTLALQVRDSAGNRSAPQRFSIVLAAAPLRVEPGGTGDCRTAPCASFAAALAAASAGDTIALDAGVYAERVTIIKDVTIIGAGPDATVIDGARSGRVVTVEAGVTASLVGLTVRGGQVLGENGGGIHNQGDLSLFDMVVADNLADNGGGIYTAPGAGGLSLSNSAILDNRAQFSGGGLHNDKPPLNVDSSLIAGNSAHGQAGGAYVGGDLTLVASTVSGNLAINDYGGSGPLTGNVNDGGLTLLGTSLIERSRLVGNRAEGNADSDVGGAIGNSGRLTITGSLLQANATLNRGTAAEGGAIFNAGTLVLAHSTVIGNTATGPGAAGGAIYNRDDGQITIRNSTLAANTARATAGSANGGAISNESNQVTIENSTISDNVAISAQGHVTNGGGAIGSGPNLTIRSSTIADNRHNVRGGGIFIAGAPSTTVTLSATILASNAAPEGPDCAGATVTSLGYTLLGSADGCSYTPGQGDAAGEPQLGPLAANGGPTPTRMPLAGSPVINRIPADSGVCPVADQRGVLRPIGPFCDIGAVESGVVYDSGFILGRDRWAFGNPLGEPEVSQFIDDYGYPATTRLVTDTQTISVLTGTVALSLPLDLSPLGLTAAISPTVPGDLSDPFGSLRVRDPIAWLVEEILVKAVIDDETSRGYQGALKSGLCAGMVAGAALAQRGNPPIDQLFPGLPPGTTPAQIAEDSPLYKPAIAAIQRYHGRQVGLQMLQHLSGPGYMDAQRFYAHLVERMGRPDWVQDPEIIGVVKGGNCADMEVGHALLPYRIEGDAKNARVFVYDPNYPPSGAAEEPERWISFDLEANRWSYELAPATTEHPAIVWDGTMLYSTPLHIFEERPQLPTLGDGMLFVSGGQRAAFGGQRAAFGGQRAAFGEDENSLRVGCIVNADGTISFIQTLTRSYRLVAFNGPREDKAFPEAIYFPERQDLRFTSVGGTTTDILVFGNGSATGLLAPAIDRKDFTTTDTLSVSEDMHTLVLETNEAQPKEVAAFQVHTHPATNGEENSARFFAISNARLSNGSTIAMTVTDSLDQVEVRSTGTTSITIGLAYFGTTAVSQVMFTDLPLAANERRVYTPINWDDLADSALLVEIYEDADDRVDRVEVIPPTSDPQVRDIFPVAVPASRVPDSAGAEFALITRDPVSATAPDHYGWVSLDTALAPGETPTRAMRRNGRVVRRWLEQGGGPELTSDMGLVGVAGRQYHLFPWLGEKTAGRETLFHIGSVKTVPLYDQIIPARRGQPLSYRIVGYAVVEIVHASRGYRRPDRCYTLKPGPGVVCGQRVIGRLITKVLWNGTGGGQ